MSKINLNNDKLRGYIKQVLGPNRYGQPWDSLVEEFFLREQYVLSLTPEEFFEDLNNFKNSVKSFGFSNKKYTATGNWLGVNIPSQKRIEFNVDYWNFVKNAYSKEEYCEMFMCTFFHECLHGAQNNKYGYNRAGGYNPIYKNRSHAIYEICTEAIALKMSKNRNKTDFYKNNILMGDGYSDELFAVGLISATFGVKERDVLKYGVRTRDELIEALNKNIGDKNLTAQFIDSIENQLEYMHSVNYPDSNQEEFINMTQSQKQNGLTESVKNLLSISQQIMMTRIHKAPSDLKEDFVVELNSNQKKIYDILNDQFRKFGGLYNDNYVNFFMKMECSNNSHYIKEAINVFDKIQQDKNGHLKNIAPYLVDAVKTGNFQYCADWGIELLNQQDLTYSVSSNAYAYNEEIGKIDFNNFKEWDNDKIFELLQYGNSFTNQIPKEQISLKSWKDLNTYEGICKYNDLKFALTENKKQYGVETKDVLLDFIENGDNSSITKITRKNNARQIFNRSYNQTTDRVYLAKLVAQKFVDKTYNEDFSPKTAESYQHKQIQEYMQDTITKYGKEALTLSIAQLLLNDSYQSFSGEKNRLDLSIIGKNNIFEVISKPLVDELLNQRTINPEKDIALKRTIYNMEMKYPGQSGFRLAEMIKGYKNNNFIQYGYIPQNQRSEFSRNFGNNENLRDLVGLLANQYSKNYMDNKNITNYNNGNFAVNPMFNDVIENFGVDYFRENMIKSIMDNDYSGFYNRYDSNLNNSNMIQDLAMPYIQNTISVGNVDKWYLNDRDNIKIDELNVVAKKQRFSKFNNFINRLVQLKDRILGGGIR